MSINPLPASNLNMHSILYADQSNCSHRAYAVIQGSTSVVSVHNAKLEIEINCLGTKYLHIVD